MNFKSTFLIYQPCPENISHVVFLFFFEGSVNMNKMSKNRFSQGKKKISIFNQQFGPITVHRQNTLFFYVHQKRQQFFYSIWILQSISISKNETILLLGASDII
jgi:hypothetical protein